ncbi:unnamed protein product [Schistosoma rodhaini]|uniref:Selenoprotein W n=1 Tax=Schistosoma rodhaini TaxID=6188 RepID=A0AA85FKF0_9TREM|nr:unnamed protein product [Schistosoma rodhaini]
MSLFERQDPANVTKYDLIRYEPKYNSFKQQLERRFPGKLEISGEGTPQSTGWFEVQVVGGPLLHSKKNGDGFVDSNKLERICNAIRDLL